MAISFASRVRVPDSVLAQEIQGEAMFLNLTRENYHGLDQVGSRMFRVLNSADCIQTAYQTLLNEYEVDEARLRDDLEAFIAELVDKGLVEICDG